MSERLLFELKAVDNATAPLRQVQNEIKKTTSAAGAFNGALGAMGKNNKKFAMGALQQAGYQVGDFAVQVANGTSKMQAMGQQLPQLLQIFGPIGAIVGAGVAVFAAFGTVMQKTGQSVTDSAAMQIAAIDGLNKAIKETIANIDELRFGGSAAKFAESEIGKLKAEMASVQNQIIGYRAAIEKATTGQAVDAAILAKDIAEAELPALQDTLTVMQDKLKVLYQNLRTQEGLAAAEEASRIQNLRKLQLLDEEQVRLENGRKRLREILSEYTDINGAIKSASEVDLASVFSKAISPSSALYQFVKKTADTMINMSKFQPRDYSGFTYGGAFAESRMAGPSNPPKQETTTTGGGGGGSKDDPLKTLRDQLALETELLGKTEAQQRVIQALGIDWKKYGATTYEGLTQQIEQMNELNRVAEMQKQISDSIKSSMEDAFMSIVDGTTSAKDAFRSMAAEIIKELYRVLVVQQMVGQLGSATSTGTGLLGGIGRLFGMRAMGGPVTGGQPYMVGERGPEIIVPSRNGSVVPNNQLGGGGVTVNQTINITTGVQQTVRAEIKSLMPQIADSAKAAVLDARRRGGSYGSAFA
jgi:hypothetical protein